MKKTISILALVLLSMSAMAGNWGIGLKAGIAQNNPKDMKDLYDEAFDEGFDEKELTKRNVYYGLEALYEWDLNDDANKLGVKIGIEGYGQNKLELTEHYFDYKYKAKENTYAFPLTIYYKRDNGIKKWSWMAGAGVTIMRSELKVEDNYDGNEKYAKTKVFPHIMAGTEYRFSQLFALGLEVRYNIAAKVKKDDGILSNRSGIGAAVTGKFYF